MKSQSQTKLLDRRSHERWMEMIQGKDMTARAYEVALKILQTHKPYPLPEGAAETMREIVIEFEKEMKLDKKVVELKMN
ncbi:MAG: hypothetical protein KJP23_27175 [Deltaproteobacteria bacterium]|nr:hypothetical protein [Deltaproteobacteria bacterium]